MEKLEVRSGKVGVAPQKSHGAEVGPKRLISRKIYVFGDNGLLGLCSVRYPAEAVENKVLAKLTVTDVVVCCLCECTFSFSHFTLSLLLQIKLLYSFH